MSCYAIGIGGTGARCIESLIHLCAAGLGPKKLTVLVVDPDEANGNVARTKQLVELYAQCRTDLAQPADNKLFGTETRRPSDHNNQPITVWSPRFGEQKLDNYFRLNLLPEGVRPLARLLYAQPELDMRLEWGFRGHPSVGAPLMARVDSGIGDRPWADILNWVRQDADAAENPTMFMFASVFGATGASGFPTLGAIMRNRAGNLARFRLGGALVLPYFSFPENPNESEVHARAANFLVNTKAAMNHYSFMWSRGQNNPYDSLYLIGDKSREAGAREAHFGGAAQNNPAHYVELLGGLAALHFFKTQEQAGPERKVRYCYAGRSREGTTCWSDIPDSPELQDRLAKFGSLGVSYLGFFHPLLTAGDFERMRSRTTWYSRHFDASELTSTAEVEKQKRLYGYFAMLAHWLYQMHEYSGGNEVELLNRRVLQDLVRALAVAEAKGIDEWRKWKTDDFADALHRKSTDAEPRFLHRHPFDVVWNNMNRVAPSPGIGSPTGRMVEMLYKSVSRFCDSNYTMNVGG